MEKSPIRIVYDGTIFSSQSVGGITRYFCRLIEEAARLRPTWVFDLHILNDGKPPARLPSGENIRVTARKYYRPGWCCVGLNYGSRQVTIRRATPTILHTTLARPFHLSSCPIVTTIHDAIVEKVPEFYMNRRFARIKRWWRWSARNADAVLTVSNTSRADIVETWSTHPLKVHVTYPGIEEAFRRPGQEEVSLTLAKFGIHRPYVLYVGHRGEHKNFTVLAEAMRSSALSGIDLVLVGGGDTTGEMQTFQGSAMPNWRHFRSVSDDELRGLYAGAAALVFPSIYEGFGFPLVEAMSCGAPVVASDIPSSREVCGAAAEFFPARSSADCAAAIKRVLDGERRCSLIKAGSERARHFNWRSCARQTIDVYEQLISEGSRAASDTGAL